MTLLQLRDKIAAICEPYITPADRKYWPKAEYDPLSIEVSAIFNKGHKGSHYNYRAHIHIGSRYFPILKDARTPRQLLKQVKEALSPTHENERGADINISK